MSVSRRGMARAVLTTAAGAGLVAVAMQVPGAVAVGPAKAGDLSVAGTTSAVRGAQLVCPGPERLGTEGIDDVPTVANVAAAAAPPRALTGLKLPSGPGAFVISGMPSGGAGAKVTERGALAARNFAEAGAATVSGTGSMAPGLAALQSWFVASGDRRGLGMAACGQPTADAWLVSGGGQPGRQERLLLSNPGGNAVTVDLTLHGAAGPVASPSGKGIVVPARGRVSVLLDAISGTEVSPAVHVVASGGLVHAVLNDSWLAGTSAQGGDDVVAAAPPSRTQVIPGVPVDGAASIRVAVPGEGEAVVQTRLLTAMGPRALPRDSVVRVQGGSTRDISLAGVATGVYGVEVRADKPVVTGALVQRWQAGRPGDYALTTSTPPIASVAGAPLSPPPAGAEGMRRWLMLSASGEPVGVEVVRVDAAGTVTSQRLTVAGNSSTSLYVTGSSSVWVHRISGKGQLRAALGAQVGDRAHGLISVAPLRDAPLRATSVGLREVAP